MGGISTARGGLDPDVSPRCVGNWGNVLGVLSVQPELSAPILSALACFCIPCTPGDVGLAGE